MLELLTIISGLVVMLLAIFLVLDSDDDNSDGGLMEPALIPVPSRKTANKSDFDLLMSE